MPCYHPLRGFPVGITDKGKPDYKIVPFAVDHLEYTRKRGWESVYVPSLSNYREKSVLRSKSIEIPCGKCDGCRIEKSRQWADRCMLEMKYHESSYFVTLTYDQAHVPLSWYADPATGEARQIMTLQKRDLQLFFKRLRKNLGQKVRYFACGEYGSIGYRPHYHAIIFGLVLDDLVSSGQSMEGFPYYESAALESCWKAPPRDRPNDERSLIGMVCVAEASWETCAYTARYVQKKLDGVAAQHYVDHNIEPEFAVMSRKPGIGRQYFDDHPEIMEFDYITIPTATGGRKIHAPRYFALLLEPL